MTEKDAEKQKDKQEVPTWLGVVLILGVLAFFASMFGEDSDGTTPSNSGTEQTAEDKEVLKGVNFDANGNLSIEGKLLTALYGQNLSLVAHDAHDSKARKYINVAGEFLVVTPIPYPDQETEGRIADFSSSKLECLGYQHVDKMTGTVQNLICKAKVDFERQAQAYSGERYTFKAKAGELFLYQPHSTKGQSDYFKKLGVGSSYYAFSYLKARN